MKWNSTFLNLLRIKSDVIPGSDQSFIPVGKQQDTNRPSMTYPDFLFPPHCRPLPPSTCFLFLAYCIDSKKLSSDQKQFQDHNKCLFFTHVTTSMSPGNASGQLSSLVMAKQNISVKEHYHKPHGRRRVFWRPHIYRKMLPPKKNTCHFHIALTNHRTAEMNPSHVWKDRWKYWWVIRIPAAHPYFLSILSYLSPPYFISTERPLSWGFPMPQSLSWLASIPISYSSSSSPTSRLS